eukprot:1502978-Pyramimonas_sp.AAC.1
MPGAFLVHGPMPVGDAGGRGRWAVGLCAEGDWVADQRTVGRSRPSSRATASVLEIRMGACLAAFTWSMRVRRAR